MPSPQQYCVEKAYQTGSSLYYSLRVLPTPTLEALISLHALFRELSDVLYECHEVRLAQIKLEWWATELRQLFHGETTHPVTRALVPVVARYQLAEHYFQELVEGQLALLEQPHFNTFADLSQYCRSSDGVASLLCCYVMGFQHDNTLQYAERLGIALALARGVRFLRRDLQQGRLTLPLETLQHFQVSEDDLLSLRHTPELQHLLHHHTQQIYQQFQTAFAALPNIDCFAQRAGLIRARLSLAALREVEADGFRVLDHRISLTPVRKLWLATITHWQARYGKTPAVPVAKHAAMR